MAGLGVVSAFLTLMCKAAIVNSEDIVGSTFRALDNGSQQIDSYGTSFSARSRVDCARGCRRHGHCSSFSYDSVSGICFLLPEMLQSGGTSTSGQASQTSLALRIYSTFTKPAPECLTSDLTTISNAGFVTRQSASSLFADVTCDEDFTLGASVSGTDAPRHRRITLTCMEDTPDWNPPVADVQCKQSAWRGAAIVKHGYPLPRPIMANWSMCLEGVSHNTDTMDVGLWKELNPAVSPFRASFNFTANRVCLRTTQTPGVWTSCQVHPMPATLTQGNAFVLKLQAVTTTVVRLVVDGVEVGSYTTPGHLGRTVGGYAEVGTPAVDWTIVNLWC